MTTDTSEAKQEDERRVVDRVQPTVMRTDLVNRLRGIYSVPINDGAGPIDGKDEFTRKFDNLPPINYEAADEIERLRNLYNELLYSVETVHPDMTRHETALMYIKNSERRDGGEATSEGA